MQLDTNITILIALGIVAIVAIVYALRYRGSGETTITGPFGMRMKAKGRNPNRVTKSSTKPEPVSAPAAENVAIDLKNVKARNNIKADADGKIKADGIQAGKDATFTSKNPSPSDNNPKA